MPINQTEKYAKANAVEKRINFDSLALIDSDAMQLGIPRVQVQFLPARH